MRAMAWPRGSIEICSTGGVQGLTAKATARAASIVAAGEEARCV